MSLRVDHARSRGRSRSPGRRDDRSRSRDIRAPSPVIVQAKKSSKKYYSDESDSDTRSRRKSARKYRDDSESDSDTLSRRKCSKKYPDDSESDSVTLLRKSSKPYRDGSESDSDPRSKGASINKRYESDDSDSDPVYKRRPSKKDRDGSDPDPKIKGKSSRKRYTDSDSDSMTKKKSSRKHFDHGGSSLSSSDENRKTRHKGVYIETATSNYEHERHNSYAPEHKPVDYNRHMSNRMVEEDEMYRQSYRQSSKPGGFGEGHSSHPQYAQPQINTRPEGLRMHAGSISSRDAEYKYANLGAYQSNGRKLPYTQSVQPQFVEVKPHNTINAPPSPPALHRLSVSGGAPGGLSLVAPGQYYGHMHGSVPPASPLLEVYHGTYQSLSPMPSPMMLPSSMDGGLSDLEPLSGGDSDDSHRHISQEASLRMKTVSLYDPEPDALAMAAALKHHSAETKPIIKIIPHLSDHHILMLRTEYKKHMKTQGKGVNIAKHIKMKLTGNFGKVAYATALGRWQSEAHWANFWYQSNSSRRELLIESLMGRTNSEIAKIKDAFSDQRYNNSLEKCMQTELKKDKFRHAVLLALEERRMSEKDKLSIELVHRDVRDLHHALTAKEGGETAMINTVVLRNNRHLAEVMRVYEGQYRKNLAREMIQKSRNLVGETLAHILNGVLNRPMRDALLLHQALAESSRDRTDLLVSRLVRFHWEPSHLERIKVAYKQKYGSRLESAMQEGTRGDFGDFCVALCKVEM